MVHGAKHPDDHNIKRMIRDYRKLLIGVGLIAALVIIVVVVAAALGEKTTQMSSSYKETSGGAGLEAAIKYDCPKQPCSYDFNVYIYKTDGTQVNVVRPDKEGVVHLAMAEGNYVMLIGTLFGDSKTFPQQSLALKNGKTLELKLEYK